MPNTQSSGAALVSFNFPAALPYGLEGNVAGAQTRLRHATYDRATGTTVMGSAAVAPISVVEMRRQTQALNYMLGAGARNHRFRIGNSVYVAWGNPYAEKDIGEVLGRQAETAEPVPVVGGEVSRKLSPAELRETVRIAMDVFNSPRSGEVHTRTPDVYLLGLTGAKGRVSITHWQQDDAAQMRERIAQWVGDLSWGAGMPWGAATASGYPWRPTLRSYERLLIPTPVGSTPTDAVNAARGRLGEQLVNAAFAGRPIPVEIQRIATHLFAVGEFPGGSGNTSRLSLCALLGAAILRSTPLSKEDMLTQPLYALGQTFALVEHLQMQIAREQQGEDQQTKAPPPLRKLQTFVAGAPSKGYDRVMEAFNVACTNRALHPLERALAEERIRTILGGLEPEAFPARADNANLFYLGYHHEGGRLWAMIQARIDASNANKARKAAEDKAGLASVTASDTQAPQDGSGSAAATAPATRPAKPRRTSP